MQVSLIEFHGLSSIEVSSLLQPLHRFATEVQGWLLTETFLFRASFLGQAILNWLVASV